MYLEKLEVQGFKSFAKKNLLVFPGMLDESKRGITAVVGPNGSGKSNVADAVRWALGEQSMKTLRGKKAEDIIFSGTEKKGKLGMAEVSLFLNNEDRKAPIDYSEIVLTRRLYRNGDSEYLLNNNRVRLADIQMLLAKAKFGQKTYSVIGQGMVEGFLSTSLSERKEFFDEATGVKQYQIKRDESLNKLRASYENLNQAQMLLIEIEPRLKSLTRQVNRLQKRGELEKDLRERQIKYYNLIWQDNNNKFSNFNEQYLELEKEKNIKQKKMDALNRELLNLETEDEKENDFDEAQAELSHAQKEKDEINMKLARIEAQLEVKLEAAGKFDLSFLLNKKDELIKEIASNKEDVANLEKSVVYDKNNEAELANKKDKINQDITKLNEKLLVLGQENGNGDENKKEINSLLKKILNDIKKITNEVDIEKVKIIASSIEKDLNEFLEISEKSNKENTEVAKNTEWQETHNELNKLTGDKEEILTKINENNLRFSARSERIKLLKEKINSTNSEVEVIENKLKQKANGFEYETTEKERTGYKEKLVVTEDRLIKAKNKLEKINSQESEKRSNLFSLQKDLQALQNELNQINNNLNEIKINSTRYETKLEDLEVEIRQELGGLEDVKKKRDENSVDLEEDKEKIRQLKRQLELIGGIDPQIEGEYNETKERHDFLSGQVNDLTKAIGSLEKIIKELDLIIKDKFDKEFKVIVKNFEKYFKILFNGGNAKIIKVMDTAINSKEIMKKDEADSEEERENAVQEDTMNIKKIKFLQKHNATGLAGIEIQATPPGKKIKSVSMLSGGERALTAIALICAIISANPSPFVVLDEVDAALDEANSERLAKILDELSYKTQFIVISHNRASMRKANILYGVTMGDDGVSKLLSVKLDEVSSVKKV